MRHIADSDAQRHILPQIASHGLRPLNRINGLHRAQRLHILVYAGNIAA
jgi:hypothetical protein